MTLTGGLFSFDSATPGTATAPVAVTGLGTYSLAAIDFRPATGQLYGLAFRPAQQFGSDSFQLCTVNPQTAVATLVGQSFSNPFISSGHALADFAFDFDPVADRVRVISPAGDNFLVRPTSGTLVLGPGQAPAYAQGDPNFGAPTNVVAMAYSNNTPGPGPSTLYGYAYSLNNIVRIGGTGGTPSPDTGQLFTIGNSTLVANSRSLGMDISATSGIAYLNADANGPSSNDNLYRLNLSTGASTLVGAIGGGMQVLDIAVKVNPPSVFPLQTLQGGGLPQDIRENNTNFYQNTTFEAPYATSLSVYVDVSDPSLGDLEISVFPGPLAGGTSRPPPGVPVFKMWDHEPLVYETGQTAERLKTTVALPASVNGQPFLGFDQYTVQVIHDVPGSGTASIGEFVEARLLVNPGQSVPPTVNLYAGFAQEPVPAVINYGDPLTLVVSASATVPLARLSISIRGLATDAGAPEIYQQRFSTSQATMSYTALYLAPGDYQIVAKAVDSNGAFQTTTRALTVNRLFGFFRVLNPVRTVNSDGTTNCPACRSVNFSATLELKNLTSVMSRNLRVRLLEVATASFIDQEAPCQNGRPCLPAPAEPIPATVGQVFPLGVGGIEQVNVSMKVRAPIQNSDRSIFNFHVYAILEEEFGSNQWISIDSLKIVDGEVVTAHGFTGPGGGVNDPPPNFGGTVFDPKKLESVAVSGPINVSDAGTFSYTASATARNKAGPTTLPVTGYSQWSTSSFSISSAGMFQPSFVTTATSVQLSASFTLSSLTKTGLLPITVYPFRITSVTVQTNGAILTGKGIPGQTAYVQASPDLVTPFSDIGLNVADSAGIITFPAPHAAGLPKRFYRLRYP
ncbi:MAG: DUF4394 domain-containing protein [Verrucomicrobiota bacterium]|nr:DUF4394 domain-containing protein [Verrucomicrobiota bacterium]